MCQKCFTVCQCTCNGKSQSDSQSDELIPTDRKTCALIGAALGTACMGLVGTAIGAFVGACLGRPAEDNDE